MEPVREREIRALKRQQTILEQENEELQETMERQKSLISYLQSKNESKSEEQKDGASKPRTPQQHPQSGEPLVDSKSADQGEGQRKEISPAKSLQERVHEMLNASKSIRERRRADDISSQLSQSVSDADSTDHMRIGNLFKSPVFTDDDETDRKELKSYDKKADRKEDKTPDKTALDVDFNSRIEALRRRLSESLQKTSDFRSLSSRSLPEDRIRGQDSHIRKKKGTEKGSVSKM